jgi:signal transduction histidine kinase
MPIPSKTPGYNVDKGIMNLRRHLHFIFLIGIMSCKKHEHINADQSAQTNIIIDHAYKLANNGEPKHSLSYLDSAYRAFPEPNHIDLWKKYNYKATYYLHYEADTAKANAYADSMFYTLKGIEQLNQVEYAGAVFSKGDALMAERKYTEAFKYYYEGKSFAKSNLDSCSVCDFSYKLALVRYNQGQYRKAIPYVKQALAENSNCKSGSGFNNKFYLPETYLNTAGLCFERSGMLDSAIIYYLRDVEFINQHSAEYPSQKQFMETATGVVYGNLGGAYSSLGNYNIAKKYLSESIGINDRPNYDKNDAQTAKIKLVDLYLRFSHFKEADKLLDTLQHAIFAKLQNYQIDDNARLKWYKLKWSYYDRTHSFLNAYNYSKRYFVLRDSANEVNKGLINADMDEAFKHDEAQYKLSLLSTDNKLKNVYLITIIIFSVMGITLLFVVWYNLKNSKKVNRQITTQNALLQNALDSLEQSQADNTRMMQIVAHDLRNPIGGITSVASLMLEEEDRSEEDRVMLELIKTSGQNSLELVSDLLQVHTRAEELKKEPVDLYQMLHYCIDLLRFKAGAKGQRIELYAVPVTLSVNREKIWRVVSNLVANAIKFSPGGAKIMVRLEEKSQHVLIAVEDHGIGIPIEMQDKIFDMFTEAKRPGTAGEQPFGLGLAISKQIVEAHGGTIWFESKEGNGTTFFVELPL